jgi:hypothetical protein
VSRVVALRSAEGSARCETTGTVCPLLPLSASERVVNHVACALRMPRCGMFHTSMGAGMFAERWDTQYGLCLADAALWRVPYVHVCGAGRTTV